MKVDENYTGPFLVADYGPSQLYPEKTFLLRDRCHICGHEFEEEDIDSNNQVTCNHYPANPHVMDLDELITEDDDYTWCI